MKESIKVRECFESAIKEEQKGKKHKGLLFTGRNDKKAEEYLQKAKSNLELCGLFREKRLDYKLPEEWFYTMYYCALAILARFGVETRSQRCTGLFLKYVKNPAMIDYDDEFIDRILVHREKERKSDVDEREEARYSASVKSEEIMQRYDFMMKNCKECISQCEEIVFSNNEFILPDEIKEIMA